ncbi:MAG: helix-turn-helix domain-containing protein [Clostridiales bacterium]|nr:helix-turn-helix domain-containing protein [Clostridiales bacterium]
MKLNADILYMNLKETYAADISGPKTDGLTLSRPEFYMDSGSDFLPGSLYIAAEDHLPRRPGIKRDVVLVCIGDSARLSYYKERCCVITIKEERDPFSVYQRVQSIFDFYDSWNDELFELFRMDEDVQLLLECSRRVFPGPVFVFGSGFNLLAVAENAGEDSIERWGISNDSLSQGSMGTFLNESELLTDTHDPIVFDMMGVNTLCVNLFDRNNIYMGCLCIDCIQRKYRPGDDALAVYLARILERSIEKNPAIPANDHAMMRQILKDLIDEAPISPKQRLMIDASAQEAGYACVVLRSLSRNLQLPGSYTCNIFEDNFPDSFSFPHGEDIVGYINLRHFCDKDGDWHKELTARLVPMLVSLKLSAGISNDFKDLHDAKICLRHAVAAIENGVYANPRGVCYFFSDYALMEMVINSLGGLSVETYFPNGLKEIIRHDEESTVGYFQTLKVFLDENMNFAKAADILFIHRSTLVDRMERIERMLGIDLADMNQRLHLQLLIKAVEIQDLIKHHT